MIPWYWWAVGAIVAFARPARARPKRGWDYESEPEPDQADDPEPDRPDYEPKPHPGASPLWPLPDSARKWNQGSFKSPRPWASGNPTSHHKGTDIDSTEGAPVVAPDRGQIVGDTGWRGPGTRGVLFQTFGGPMLVFGAVAPDSYPAKGTILERGEIIARIGRYPGGDTMLHFEVYQVGTTKRVKWPWGTDQPDALVNPNSYLSAMVDA